ncbi:hypothetical protein QYE76_043819 [Lolium multiflorum]|uniref:Uncharacterized protein n=1 Tax=Lolium multiflorum TaxID=4521 RepID=A0AAD8TI23_LOLMU|nr:hypothetical protein QYE76_043819 [Lolium multiflorum]
MGIHGHPLEIQALFCSALLCASELFTPEDGSADLIPALNSRLMAFSFHIREYYWLEKRKIPPWLVEGIPQKGGYFIGNLNQLTLISDSFLWGTLVYSKQFGNSRSISYYSGSSGSKMV